jgi:hypothetical protein
VLANPTLRKEVERVYESHDKVCFAKEITFKLVGDDPNNDYPRAVV